MIDSPAAILQELSAKHGTPPLVGGVVVNDLIASGGMGAVFRGVHLRLRIPVAIKFLYEFENMSSSRFTDEASICAKINHPNVVRVYDVNKDGKLLYILQEFVEGHNAEYHLERSARYHQPLSEDFVLNLAADAARGLSAIHNAGYLHLDIKPGNIMVSKRDGVCKILDLGLAMQFNSARQAAEGGTPGYASPEQLMFLPVGPSSDLYSLGVTMYELLAGKHAHASRTWRSATTEQTTQTLPPIREVRPEIADSTAAIVERCLHVDAFARFQTAMEMLSHIARAHQTRVSKRIVSIPGPQDSVRITGRQDAPLVFCVDDNPQLGVLFGELLVESGYRTDIFTEGAVALAKMEKTPPDVVLLDVEMPTMSGLEVCKAMRANPLLKNIPVVFLTGSNDPENINLAMNLGATDYLFKPVQAEELLSRVGCLTRITRAHRELEALEKQYSGFRTHLSTLSGKEQL